MLDAIQRKTPIIMAKKLSKLARKALVRFSDNIMKMIVLPLMQWAGEGDDGEYFFIILGNKYVNDVAWFNTTNLSVEGALSVADDPDAAAVFEFIKTTFDIQITDNIKDEKFNKHFQEHALPSDTDNGWVSTDLLPD